MRGVRVARCAVRVGGRVVEGGKSGVGALVAK